MNEIKKNFEQFKKGIKTMFKEFFKKDTNKKQRANMWTFSRLVCAFIIPILTTIGALLNSLPITIAAFTTAGIGAITDFFDGRSARKHNSTSEFGALLDVVTDKVFSLLLGVSLAILNPVFLLNIAGETAITLTNSIYKIKHEELKLKSSKIGKIKQWPLFLTFVLGIMSILYPALIPVTNATIITTFLAQLATVTDYAIKNSKQVENIERINTITEVTSELEEKEEKEQKEKELTDTQRRKEELIKLRDLLAYHLNEQAQDKEKIRKRTLDN